VQQGEDEEAEGEQADEQGGEALWGTNKHAYYNADTAEVTRPG